MKSKNFKSVIHNFAYSLQSIDYTRCRFSVFYELIQLNTLHGLENIEFDFIKNTISPKEAINDHTVTILEDYGTWLPKLCESQNCDFNYIETLTIKISLDFDHITRPLEMKTTFQIQTQSHTIYKIKDKNSAYIDLTFHEWIEKIGLSSHIITTYINDKS